MIQDRMTKSQSFRVKIQPTSHDLLNQKSKNHRYDTSLYHKTNFHLKPIKDNPELYTKVTSISSKIGKIDYNPQKQTEKDKKNNKKIVIPQSISIRAELTKFAGLQKNIQKVLEEETVMLITSKKWVIFDMLQKTTIKGFKHKKQHDVASLTKILTFYTAYMVIQKYFLSIDKLQMYVDEQDQQIQGTKIKIKSEYLMSFEDLLYGMMLESANNAATVIATNLGSLITKKKQGKYFSCFDIPRENKQQNMQTFLNLMNAYALQLGAKNSLFPNVHGMCKNKSTASDIALIMSQCYKIPLFCQLVTTKTHIGQARYVSDEGEVQSIKISMTNTNQLLWSSPQCVGGKTGCNSIGGESLAVCYEGGVIVVVLGCGSREDKFADAQKLIGWLQKRLKR